MSASSAVATADTTAPAAATLRRPVAAPNADERRPGGCAPPDWDRGVDSLDHAREPVDELALQRLIEDERRRGPRRGAPSGRWSARRSGRRARRPRSRSSCAAPAARRTGRRPFETSSASSAASPRRRPRSPLRGRVPPAPASPAATPVAAIAPSSRREAVQELLLVDDRRGARALEPLREPLGGVALALGAGEPVERRQRLDHLAQGLDRRRGPRRRRSARSWSASSAAAYPRRGRSAAQRYWPWDVAPPCTSSRSTTKTSVSLGLIAGGEPCAP